jgi:AcrR family transcriptional regulator
MQQTGARHQERRAETHARLLAAAIEVFGERGFEAATVDEIATRAGYSKGAFYFHFPSKEDIFLELLRCYVLNDRDDRAGAAFADAEERRRRVAPLLLEFWAHAARNERIRAGLRRLYDARCHEILDSLPNAAEASSETWGICRTVAAIEDGLLLQEVLGIKSTGLDRSEIRRRLLRAAQEHHSSRGDDSTRLATLHLAR